MNDAPRKSQGVSWRRRSAGLVIFVLLSGVAMLLLSQKWQFFRIRSGSMLPTLHIGDFVLVDARASNIYQRGDIVVFRHPLHPRRLYCKRLVALPGDRVAFYQGWLYVNERRAGENYVLHPHVPVHRDRAMLLGTGEYFMLGDNRALSLDSYEFGPVPQDFLVGRVRSIYWPRDRARRL